MKATKFKHKCIKERGTAHHWMLPSPNGKYSRGVCKYCKAEYDMQNSIDISNWYRNIGSWKNPKNAKVHGYTKPNVKQIKKKV